MVRDIFAKRIKACAIVSRVASLSYAPSTGPVMLMSSYLLTGSSDAHLWCQHTAQIEFQIGNIDTDDFGTRIILLKTKE